jgi:hypothetical protein
MLFLMVIDLNLENFFLAAATVTKHPLIGALPILYKTIQISYPSSVPYELPRLLNAEENSQKERIQAVIKKVMDDLDIPPEVPISLHIASRFAKDSCILGSTSSIKGPILVLSSAYLKSFHQYVDEEFAEWSAEFSALSNNPIELARQLDIYPQEKLDRLKELSLEFLHKPSEQELSSVIAHELGHAKFGHALKEQGFFALALLANKIATVIAIYFGVHLLYCAISIPLTYLCTKFISKEIEKEADSACVWKYKQGIIDFHKKRLIVQLLDNPSKKYDQIQDMLHSWDLFYEHPNAAKRLLAASSHPLPSPHEREINNIAQVLSILGIGKMAQENFSVLNHVFTAI